MSISHTALCHTNCVSHGIGFRFIVLKSWWSRGWDWAKIIVYWSGLVWSGPVRSGLVSSCLVLSCLVWSGKWARSEDRNNSCANRFTPVCFSMDLNQIIIPIKLIKEPQLTIASFRSTENISHGTILLVKEFYKVSPSAFATKLGQEELSDGQHRKTAVRTSHQQQSS